MRAVYGPTICHPQPDTVTEKRCKMARWNIYRRGNFTEFSTSGVPLGYCPLQSLTESAPESLPPVLVCVCVCLCVCGWVGPHYPALREFKGNTGTLEHWVAFPVWRTQTCRCGVPMLKQPSMNAMPMHLGDQFPVASDSNCHDVRVCTCNCMNHTRVFINLVNA